MKRGGATPIDLSKAVGRGNQGYGLWPRPSGGCPEFCVNVSVVKGYSFVWRVKERGRPQQIRNIGIRS